MYIWHVNDLVEDFKRGEVNGKDQFKYYLFFLIGTVLATNTPWAYEGYKYTDIDTINTIIMLCITIGGLYYCYKKNEKGDHKDFIVRAFCLGFPITVRMVAVLLPILILMYGILEIDDIERETNKLDYISAIEVIVFNVWMLFYYLYLGKKIEEVAMSKSKLVD